MHQEQAAAEPAAAPAAKVKRPATAYSRYVKDKYSEIAASHPDKKGVKELGAIVAEAWASLSEAQKVSPFLAQSVPFGKESLLSQSMACNTKGVRAGRDVPESRHWR